MDGEVQKCVVRGKVVLIRELDLKSDVREKGRRGGNKLYLCACHSD